MSTATGQRRWIWGVVLAGGLAGLAVCLAAGFLVWKTLIGEKPGEGKVAEAGYAASAPVIAALERYRAEQGAYPDDLSALQPDYLAELPPEADPFNLAYRKDAAGYELTFSYAGPGMNRCTYRPEGGWNCSGYY